MLAVNVNGAGKDLSPKPTPKINILAGTRRLKQAKPKEKHEI